MKPGRSILLPNLIVPLTLFVVSAAAFGQDNGSEQAPPVVASKEYFVQQQAGEAVVVKISAFEARFVARLSAELGDMALESGLPEAQMLPVFQFVAVSDIPRQVNIEVDATQTTNRTGFELGLTRLNIRDDRSVGIASAYKLLSDGLEILPDGNTPDWSVRVQTLLRASNMFEGIGREELRLWSRTFAAHLVLHRMRDFPTALDWADELLSEPRISRYPEIAFAARKMRSSAMIGGRINTGGADPLTSGLQQALIDTIESARSLGYDLEVALALEASGVDLLDQGMHRQAMQRFNAALDIATRIEADDLASEIREHMVDIHSQAGNLDASGDVLQDIETHLAQEGEDQELAINLLRQGRLLIESFRFTEAISVLSRAVELEQSSLTRLEAELAVGHALTAAGRNDQALIHLTRAVLQPQSGGFRRPSGVLDIATALDQIAAIHRDQGNWDDLQEIRDAQSRFVSTPADSAQLAYQRALDSVQRNGQTSTRTGERFEQSFQQASNSRLEVIRILSRLGLCSQSGTREGRCDVGTVTREFDLIQESGTPWQITHATLFFSQWLARSGQVTRAYQVMDRQLDELVLAGYTPLGAWYWHWRNQFVTHYLELAISMERMDSEAGAWVSLLALAKARLFERGRSEGMAGFDAGEIRSFVRGLAQDAVVVSYFFGTQNAYAWVANRNQVRRVAIPGSDRINRLIRELREAIQTGSWTAFSNLGRELGSLLVNPIASDLEDTILLVSHGALLGIPFDALSVNETPLVADHQVIHLDDFPAKRPMAISQPFEQPDAVFLAGDPQDWTGEFASRLDVSAEVRAVSDQFVGPGLHAIQGVSLLADEFQDQRYGLAGLIHLSVPAIVDLSTSRSSGLFLSEPTRGEGRQRLDAEELAALPNRARLVFLSRTEFIGTGTSLENRLGLISAILDAGADAVISSLWPLEPSVRESFVADFYDRLAEEQNIIVALVETKRDALSFRQPQSWAGFQLFLN